MTPRPTIQATRPTHVLAAGVLGFAAAGLALRWWQGTGGSLPVPGPVSWASVVLIALGLGWLALSTRRVVRDDRASLDAEQAVTRVLLGKAALLVGALLAGAYAALVLVAVPSLPAPLAVDRLVHGSAAALASGAVAVAGGLLEASCRIPPSDEDDDTPGGPGEGDEDFTERRLP